jgi:hypothetical protein
MNSPSFVHEINTRTAVLEILNEARILMFQELARIVQEHLCS